MVLAHFDPGGKLAHDFCRGHNLLDRLTLGSYTGQETSDLDRRRATGHDLLHDRAHLVPAQVDTVNDVADGLFYVHFVHA